MMTTTICTTALAGSIGLQGVTLGAVAVGFGVAAATAATGGAGLAVLAVFACI